MAQCGVPRIDSLLAGDAGVSPIEPGDADLAAVGAAQDLLRAHGYAALPDLRSANYGRFGELTRGAVLGYRTANNLGAEAYVDGPLLTSLVTQPASQPCAARAYLTLVLDCEFAAPLALLALTSLFESAGRFDCLNCNTDRAGLSLGIIQWAQKPGRLHELLAAFDAAAPGVFRNLAGGDETAAALLAHTASPNGGVDPRTGATTNPAFDLVASPWKERFLAMGRAPELQKAQVDRAVAAFQASVAALRQQAPAIVSQRGVGFMADMANQHGGGGAAAIYKAVSKPGLTETQLLAAMQQESVRRMAAQFGAASAETASTASRREFFRTTPALSDDPY